MAVIIGSGNTDRRGYYPIAAGFPFNATLFLRLSVPTDQNTLPFRYADVIQIVEGFPLPTDFAEISYQPIWLDCVELILRRDYGTLPTQLWVNWHIQGIPFSVYQI